MSFRVRKLNDDGDIETSGIIFHSDKESIAQTIMTRLKLFTGEYFRNNVEGMPWFEKEDGSEGILSKGYSLSQVESIIRNRISNTDGVLTILQFQTQLDQTRRWLTVKAVVMTNFGTVEINDGFGY